jgi:hypothetical protein
MATPLNKSILEVLFSPATPRATRAYFGRNITVDLTDELVTILATFMLAEHPRDSKRFRAQQGAKRTDYIKKLTKVGGSLHGKKLVVRRNWSRLYRILMLAYDPSYPANSLKPVNNGAAAGSSLVSSGSLKSKQSTKSPGNSKVDKNTAGKIRKLKVTKRAVSSVSRDGKE